MGMCKHFVHNALTVVQLNKVKCKISALYVKACKRKVRNTEYFPYYKL